MAQVEGLASEVATIRGACDAGLLESEDRLLSVMSEAEELERACDLDFANLNRFVVNDDMNGRGLSSMRMTMRMAGD